MHGRVKVRTSAEEAARKKKEQQQKVILYRAAMTKIFQKKTNNEFDDEMMQITGVVLSKNPDITTLWNCRRQFIQRYHKETLETDTNNIVTTPTTADDDTTNDSVVKDDNKMVNAIEIIDKKYKKDLEFTESCLLVNPKSYCVWHHRCWILENEPNPNWLREVELCTKYLKMDERNFHVWDYRRYVVEKAGVLPKSELDFCTEKIQKNFSNYSSWHYRSKLLPILYPHETDSTRPINQKVLKDELEMVLTAAFTDPNDSSAWFYQRWLLGYSRPALDIAAFKLTKTHAIITFTTPVNLKNDKTHLTLDSTAKFETKLWTPIPNTLAQYSSMWMLEDSFELNTNTNDTIQLEFTDEMDKIYLLNVRRTDFGGLFGIKMPKFGYEFESVVLDELENQLKSCDELLELEPDSKWTLLTSTLLMRAVDRKKYHQTTQLNLEKLKKADPMRIGYYADLANKWCIEEKLENWIDTNLTKQTPIDLSDIENLQTIYYEQYLCVIDEIRLSNCSLRDGIKDKLMSICNFCKVNVLE